MSRVATIILNRNLKDVTDQLYDHINSYDEDSTDIYIVDAGSDADKLSSYTTWHAQWPEAIKHGLRFNRGMNFGLSKLWEDGSFEKYDAFFLITNDTILPKKPSIKPLIDILDQHPRIGILSPCGSSWGERFLLEKNSIKYFWFIHNNALLLRKEFIESIMNYQEPNYINFLFDGNNFRGYGSESEIIAKAYINDWSAAITSKVFVGENESYLLNHSDLIKTEKYKDNIKLYLDEGHLWMRNKYGFNSHWSMQQHVKSFYDKFFDYYPEYKVYRI